MSITMRWHNEEQRILYMIYEGRWTWGQYYETAEAAKQEIRMASPHRVDIIALMTGSFVPSGSSQMHGESVVKNAEPNMGLIVIVSTSYLVNMLMSVSAKVNKEMREKYRSTRSIEEAESIIAESRQKSSYDA